MRDEPPSITISSVNTVGSEQSCEKRDVHGSALAVMEPSVAGQSSVAVGTLTHGTNVPRCLRTNQPTGYHVTSRAEGAARHGTAAGSRETGCL